MCNRCRLAPTIARGVPEEYPAFFRVSPSSFAGHARTSVPTSRRCQKGEHLFNRRQLTIAGLASSAPGLVRAANVPEDDPLPPLPADLAGAGEEEDFFSIQLGQQQLGTADPGALKRDFAKQILSKAPKDCQPIDVASYFRDLGLGKTEFGEEGRPYARGWPRLYNPLIIEFFRATGTNPLSPGAGGDATPWCAAFINYCIAKAASKSGNIGDAERKRGTRSASSGSFRCFGKPVPADKPPSRGDIAVWALQGTIDGCKFGSGHVGFVVSSTDDLLAPYLVLGGNQGGDLLKGDLTRRDGVFLKKMPATYPASKDPPRYKGIYGYRTAYF